MVHEIHLSLKRYVKFKIFPYLAKKTAEFISFKGAGSTFVNGGKDMLN